jgi:hypothetical protein
MVRFLFLGIFLAAVASPFVAQANEKPRFSDTTLELCPVEYAQFEEEWTTQCLINAVRAWNVGALIELTASPNAFRCVRDQPCNEDFALGPAPWRDAPMEKRSLFDMISASQEVTVEYVSNEDGTVEAIFYPGWSKNAHSSKPELTNANWMNSFFVCKMEFQPDLGVWLIADDFCHSDTGTMPLPRELDRPVDPLPGARNA